MHTDYDVIVVGAGIFGSCTAYHCQKLGLKTLLLEKFQLGHENGSSHGKSRITRYAHTESEYVSLVSDAYEQLFELEKTRNEKLWKKTGLLWVSTGNEVQKIAKVLSSHKVQHEVLQGPEIGKKYPQFTFGTEWSGLVDPMGGVIYADKWLNAFRDEFKKLGGVIQANEEVTSHKSLDKDRVSVKTPRGEYISKKVVFTVGAWISKHIPRVNFNIEPISISVCYWRAKEEHQKHLLNEDNFPVFIANEWDRKEFHFALPDTDYPGMIKFTYHTGDPLGKEFEHPPKRTEEFITAPGKFIQNHVPVVDGVKVGKVDFCKYTNSPDSHYIIGNIPDYDKNVLVGGCGSGSGFKVAPAIGRALAEMAAGRKTTVDVSFFSMDRFNKEKSNSKL